MKNLLIISLTGLLAGIAHAQYQEAHSSVAAGDGRNLVATSTGIYDAQTNSGIVPTNHSRTPVTGSPTNHMYHRTNNSGGITIPANFHKKRHETTNTVAHAKPASPSSVPINFQPPPMNPSVPLGTATGPAVNPSVPPDTNHSP